MASATLINPTTIQELSPGLFAFAYRAVRQREEAEDLVQDTFIQALQSFHRYVPGTNCRAWLVSILHHLRSNRRRAALRRTEIQDVDDHIAETVPFVPAVPQSVTDDDMLAALRGIPEPYQAIIVLCDVEDMTYKEIAEALAIPIGTVMSRLHRGRAALRQELSRMTATAHTEIAPVHPVRRAP